MVDCYLTTFKNNKGIFGDKKKVSQDIIENPSKYHIYEGIKIFSRLIFFLSTYFLLRVIHADKHLPIRSPRSGHL